MINKLKDFFIRELRFDLNKKIMVLTDRNYSLLKRIEKLESEIAKLKSKK